MRSQRSLRRFSGLSGLRAHFCLRFPPQGFASFSRIGPSSGLSFPSPPDFTPKSGGSRRKGAEAAEATRRRRGGKRQGLRTAHRPPPGAAG